MYSCVPEGFVRYTAYIYGVQLMLGQVREWQGGVWNCFVFKDQGENKIKSTQMLGKDTCNTTIECI